MRVLLDHLDPLLAEALGHLLASVGHQVLLPGEEGAVDLTVRSAPSAGGASVAARAGPVLCLRPGERGEAAADPVAALQAALAGGPPAVWDAPLDPARLLQVLGEAPSSARPPSTVPADAAFSAAGQPWFLLRTTDGALTPLNAEARRLPAPGSPGGLRAALPSPEVLAAVRGSDQGAWLVETVPGQEAFALWWTPRSGERLLAWIPWRRVTQAEDRGTLKALAELGRISSTFAHEVRNPLASIVSALDLLKGPLGETDRAEVIALAEARVGHLRSLLDDSLRLVRSFRGLPEPVDLAEVLASARALAVGDPLFQGIELVLEVPDPLPQPFSYAEPLRQALTNLLINAAHAQGPGGRVRLVVEADAREVCVAVVDQGPGIPASLRERVFEPFWTTKPQGTGLGLAFVRRLAEASGGRALAADTPPPGARLEIRLPLAR